jgi:hypothetical protein
VFDALVTEACAASRPRGPQTARRLGELPANERIQAMRFLCYTMGDPNAPVGDPEPEMYQKMGDFMEEAIKAGVLVATGGVGPLDEAVRVNYHDGEYTVLDGPFTEAKELIGGWALLECRDRAEVVEWTKRFLGIVGFGETTIRPVVGGDGPAHGRAQSTTA